MSSINQEIEIIQTAKENLADTLINTFGVQAQDEVDAGNNVTSEGLSDSSGKLKRLSEWAPLLNSAPSKFVTQEEVQQHEEIAAAAIVNLNNKLEEHEEIAAAAITSLNNKLSNLDLNIFEVVSTLPTSNINENKVYLVPSSTTGTQNAYTEYKRVNNNWEKLGEYKSDVDLTEYAKNEALSNYLPLAGGTMLGTINSQDVLPKINATYNLGNNSYRYNAICGSYLNIGNSTDNTNYGAGYIQHTGSWFSLTGPSSTTANESKVTTLVIGNSGDISTTTAHQEGRLGLYSSGSGAHYLSGLKTDSEHSYTHTFLNANGYLLQKNTTDAVGSSTQPVYINSNGEATACTSLNADTVDGSHYDPIFNTLYKYTAEYNKTNATGGDWLVRIDLASNWNNTMCELVVHPNYNNICGALKISRNDEIMVSQYNGNNALEYFGNWVSGDGIHIYLKLRKNTGSWNNETNGYVKVYASYPITITEISELPSGITLKPIGTRHNDQTNQISKSFVSDDGAAARRFIPNATGATYPGVASLGTPWMHWPAVYAEYLSSDNSDYSLNLLTIPKKSGTLATLDDIPSASNFVQKSGDTMQGALTTSPGDFRSGTLGLNIGGAHIGSVTSTSDMVIANSNIRFTKNNVYDWDQWAGLGYDPTIKTIKLGIADETNFKANDAQNDGNILLPGIKELKLENSVSTNALSLKFHHNYDNTLDWNAEIAADYFGNNYNTTTGWAHGMYFVSGRQDFDNFIFLKNDKTPLFKIDKTGGFAATGESTINNNKVLHTGVQTLTDAEKTQVRTNIEAAASNHVHNEYVKEEDLFEGVNANGYDYVDLGLPSGTLWAEMPVVSPNGVEFFAWGDPQEKNTFSWSTYPDGDGTNFTKYKVDGKTELDLEDDPANVYWGGDWRSPSDEQFTELREHCTWTWMGDGYKVEGLNGSSIFMPAAGYYGGSSPFFAGSNGYYWSRSLYTKYSDSNESSYGLSFQSSTVSRYVGARNMGLYVWPVLEKAKKIKPELLTDLNKLGSLDVVDTNNSIVSKAGLSYKDSGDNGGVLLFTETSDNVVETKLDSANGDVILSTGNGEIRLYKNHEVYLDEDGDEFLLSTTYQELSDAQKAQVKSNLGLIENTTIVNLNECALTNEMFATNKTFNEKFKLVYTTSSDEGSMLLTTENCEELGIYRIFTMVPSSSGETQDAIDQQKIRFHMLAIYNSGGWTVSSVALESGVGSVIPIYISQLQIIEKFSVFDSFASEIILLFAALFKRDGLRIRMKSEDPVALGVQLPISIEYTEPIMSINLWSTNPDGEGIFTFTVGDSDITDVEVPYYFNVITNLNFEANKRYVLSVFENCIAAHEITQN